MVISLHEGRRVNAVKVHLLLELVGLCERRGMNALKVYQQLRLKDGGQSLRRTKSECAQGPPAIEAKRWWLVFMA